MTPIILAFLALLLGGIAYFNAWIKLCLLFLVVFFSLDVWICYGLFVPGHSVIFWVITCILVLWPTFLLILFGLDMRYGWFCFDMSYSWAFVWGFAIILFGINLVGSILRLLLTKT
ncbi:MAG: hypothetical protein ACE5IC_09590 [Candidatus Brocadiales bacterium]